MRSIKFREDNIPLGESQEEYQTLHVHVETKEVPYRNPQTRETGMTTVPWTMTACFALSKEEIDEFVRTGKLWHTQSVFGQKFQPVYMTTQSPFEPQQEFVHKIQSLRDLCDKIPEGKLLTAALAMLTTQLHPDKTPEEVIGMLNDLADTIYTKQTA